MHYRFYEFLGKYKLKYSLKFGFQQLQNMQVPGPFSSSRHKVKKFTSKKISYYPILYYLNILLSLKNFLYFGKKPDFTYYSSSWCPMKSFLCFLKKPSSCLGHFSAPRLKKPKSLPWKNLLYFPQQNFFPQFRMAADQALTFNIKSHFFAQN